MIKFSTNPILFKIEQINGDRFDTTTGASGVLGKAVHKALEVYYVGSDVLIPTNEAEAIEYGLKAGMELLENYNDGFITFSKTIPNKQKMQELLAFCFNAYVQQMPHEPGSILSCEEGIKESISVRWRGQDLKLPVALKGYLDKITRGADGKIRITDYKTCYAYSNPDKIDGAKIIQAIIYYLLTYAKYGEEPYSLLFEEIKYTKNADKSPQVRQYEIVFAENELFFDFFFRFYEDITRALNGEQVFVPNVHALFDNEVAIIAYIHRLDDSEETARLMKKHKVTHVSDLLKKQIQSAGNMRRLMKSIEESFVEAKNLDYDKMENHDKIRTKLMEHGMLLTFEDKVEGSTVDLYRFMPSIGLKMAKLAAYTADVEQVLGSTGVRVLAPIPDTNLVGFEVPRKVRSYPSLPIPTGDFNIAIGENLMGQVRRFDIRTAPHMLVAGSTGAGKSVFLNAVIQQLMTVPNVQLCLFDPKKVELSQYEGQVFAYEDSRDGIYAALQSHEHEMNRRYEVMKSKGVKKIEDMPELPYRFLIIDEFADLAMRGQVGDTIQSMAQLGRAAGIHLILATQRASTQVINGDTKTNFPVKVVFKMAKGVDSRVMIDEEGAEKLLGKGDMLFAADSGIERLQGYSV